MSRIVDIRTEREGYVTVHALTLEGDDGGKSRREVVSFGQSACVLPYDPERKLALVVSGPRAPLLLEGVEEPLIEAPAGMIDKGETPEATARREAMEEAGVRLGTLTPVAVCWSSPGVLAERSHLFLAPYSAADRIGRGGGLASEHEAIVVREIALADLWLRAAAGELGDMKTLTLTLSLRARRPDLF